MSDLLAWRAAIIADLKEHLSVPVWRQVTPKTPLPYVRVSQIAGRRREMNAAGLVFSTTLRIYAETAKGHADEAWTLADQIVRRVDHVRYTIEPHLMTDMIVTQQASVVDIGLQLESVAIDISTILVSGESP